MIRKRFSMLYALTTPRIEDIEAVLKHCEREGLGVPQIFINDINVLHQLLINEEIADKAIYKLFHLGGGVTLIKEIYGQEYYSHCITDVTRNLDFDFIVTETDMLNNSILLKEVILEQTRCKQITISIVGENELKEGNLNYFEYVELESVDNIPTEVNLTVNNKSYSILDYECVLNEMDVSQSMIIRNGIEI